MNKLCLLFAIINSYDEKKLKKIVSSYQAGFQVVMHGMGTASSSLLAYFGLEDVEKTIFISAMPSVMCKNVLKRIEKDMNVHERGKGIFFSISLSSATKYMLDFYQDYEMEDIEMEDAKQHLIITIVNEGHADVVMVEAKKGGATGGTTVNGRGLQSEKAIKFLNVSIEPEKDIVLILAPTEKKNDIMKAIVENCGLKTPGAGICFSLPVDHVVGLHKEIVG